MGADRANTAAEFETFSMNIDGLFSYVAHAAGIKEQILDLPIYHLEHEVGSGWSPEGEALLRKRIAERGITAHHRRSFLPVSQMSLDFSAAPADVVLDPDQLAQLIVDAGSVSETAALPESS